MNNSIREKIENAFTDMNAHYYNNYTNDSEYNLYLTVEELKWLQEKLSFSKWIKCNEELPIMKFDGIDQHVSEDILITNGKYIDIGLRETLLSYEDSERIDNWCWWSQKFGFLDKKDITHWMPLPKLPKD